LQERFEVLLNDGTINRFTKKEWIIGYNNRNKTCMWNKNG